MHGKRLSMAFTLGLFLLTTLKPIWGQYCDPNTDCNDRFEFIKSGPTNITLNTCKRFGVEDRTGTDTIFALAGAQTEVRAKILQYVNSYAFMYVDWNNSGTFTVDETYQMTGSSQLAAGHVVYVVPPPGIANGTYRARFQNIGDADLALYGPGACAENANQYVDVSLTVTDEIPEGTSGGSYCNSGSYSSYCGYYYINRVTIQGDGAGINRTSGCDRYYDGTNSTVRWTTGNPYTIQTENYRSTTVDVQTAVFIDWNQDFDFDDPGESFTSPVNYQTQDFVIPVPADIPSGKRRIRINSSFNIPSMPCGTFFEGETEDYTIDVINILNPPPSCVPRSTYVPANLAKGICTDLDTIFWGTVANAEEYEFTLKLFGTSINLIEETVNTNYALVPEGTLQAARTYQIEAVAINGGGEAQNCQTSRFSTSSAFGDIVITPSESFTMCLGDIEALDATITPSKAGDSHSWSGPSGFLSANNIKNPDLLASQIGKHDFTFILTNDDGCVKEVPVSVEVFNSPAGTDVKDTLGELCLGDKFITTVLPGNDQVLARAIFTVERLDVGLGSFVSTSDKVVGNQLTITQNQLGKHIYRLKVNLNGCIVYSREIDIEVFAIPDLPNISPSGNLSFCRGDVSELEVTNFSTGLEWNTGRVGPTLNLDQSGVYNVTYTSPQGCISKSLDVNVDIKEPPIKPNIELIGNGVYCQGDVVPLTATVDADYFWSNGSSDDTIFVGKSGTYGLTVTAPNGCQNFATPVVLEFKALPPAPIIFEIADFPLCEGDEVKLLNQGLEPVIWSTGETGDEITIEENGSYFAYTQAGNCKNYSANFDYAFGELPQEPEIALTPDGPYCQGQEVKAFIKNGLRVTWSTGETKDTITVSQTNTLKAVHRAVNGCEGVSLPEDVVFAKTPLKPSIINAWDSLRVQEDIYPKYAWFKQGTRLENEDKYFIIPEETSTFTVMALSAEGCESPMSDPSFMVVGLKEHELSPLITYPNPFNESFVISCSEGADEIELYTVEGKKVSFEMKQISNKRVLISTRHKGYLLLKLRSKGKAYAKTIISN